MEQIELWDWKKEPTSPSSTSFGDVDDEWLSIDDKSESLINDTLDPVLYEENEHPTRAQVATKLLAELDEWIKEEPFSDWLEEKVEFLFEDIPPPECGQNKPIIYSTIVKQPQEQTSTTQSLLQEFETVFDDVEACHQIYPATHLTLTPPQSPPPPPSTPTPIIEKIEQQLPIDTDELLLTLEPPVQETSLNKSYFNQISGDWNAENISLVPLAGDVDSELAAVDEYVRSCVEDISPSSPCTSSNSSFTSEESNDDLEWTINSSTSSSSSSSSIKSNSNNKNISKQRNRLTKNRSKPYSRPNVEDKKIRKKEQNKNAATRYRQKKKAEIKEIVGEEQELMDHNDKLSDQVKDLQREIGYLKGLMRDLFKAKGLIK